jgi:hypothetical protein
MVRIAGKRLQWRFESAAVRGQYIKKHCRDLRVRITCDRAI